MNNQAQKPPAPNYTRLKNSCDRCIHHRMMPDIDYSSECVLYDVEYVNCLDAEGFSCSDFSEKIYEEKD